MCPLPVCTWSLRASPRMVEGTRAPSPRQGWSSGSSSTVSWVTSGSAHNVLSLSFRILKMGGRGMTSTSQVAMGRLFGGRGSGEKQRHQSCPHPSLDSPSPLSQGQWSSAWLGQKAEPALVVAAGQTCSCSLRLGSASGRGRAGLAALWRD